MKLPIIEETILTHVRNSGVKRPESISKRIMEHVLGRTRKDNPGPYGGHTYVSAGDKAVIITYNANGLVEYISTHSLKEGIEDVRK